jgi:hypothetical protein
MLVINLVIWIAGPRVTAALRIGDRPAAAAGRRGARTEQARWRQVYYSPVFRPAGPGGMRSQKPLDSGFGKLGQDES